MQLATFQSQLKRLCEVYGERMYPAVRCEMIWRLTKHCPDKEFIEIVDSFIADSRQPPFGEQFGAMLLAKGVRVPTAQTRLNLKLQCGHTVASDDYTRDPVCLICLREGNLLEVALNPRRAEVPVELSAWAKQFEPGFSESLPHYARRILPELKDVARTMGYSQSRGNLSANVKSVFSHLHKGSVQA